MKITQIHSTFKDLGNKKLVPDIQTSIDSIIEIWPNVIGELVSGTNGEHRAYWYEGKLVAYTWPSKRNKIWLKTRSQK